MSKEMEILRNHPEGKVVKVEGGGVADSIDRSRVKGRVTLIQTDEKGNVIDVREESNLVVNGAYNLISEWATGASDDTFASIAVGEGGHVPGNPTIPIPPSETDTALETEIARKNISLMENPDPMKSKFTAVFLTTEGNGDLTEAGLFTAAGTMFARVTFSVIVKSGTNLIVRWEITF